MPGSNRARTVLHLSYGTDIISLYQGEYGIGKWEGSSQNVQIDDAIVPVSYLSVQSDHYVAALGHNAPCLPVHPTTSTYTIIDTHYSYL